MSRPAWLAVLAGILLAASWGGLAIWHQAKGDAPPGMMIDRADYPLLRSGDLIFRRGRGLVSEAVIAAGQGARYSHVGLVLVKENEVFVVHAAPKETGQGDGRVRRQPLHEFANAREAETVAIFRVRDETDTALRPLEGMAEAVVGQPFDSDFNLDTEDRLYCTELVWRLYRQIGVELIGQFDHFSLPLFSRSVILPDSLITPRLTQIMQRQISSRRM